jgi:hypothetical protein
MPKPNSMDLRRQVIESIAAGASQPETAELYGIYDRHGFTFKTAQRSKNAPT